jgi:hypothetical protein
VFARFSGPQIQNSGHRGCGIAEGVSETVHESPDPGARPRYKGFFESGACTATGMLHMIGAAAWQEHATISKGQVAEKHGVGL